MRYAGRRHWQRVRYELARASEEMRYAHKYRTEDTLDYFCYPYILFSRIRHDLYKHLLFDNIDGIFVYRNTCIMRNITIFTLFLH